MLRLVLIALICLTVLGSYANAHAFPENYLSAKLGASVQTKAKIMDNKDPNVLMSDGPLSRGGFVFGDVDQDQWFVVDFGSRRTFDRVDFGADNGGGGRCVKQVDISVSDKGPDGPFRKVYTKKDFGLFQILRLPSVTARWVRFDVGKGTPGKFMRSLRIYKGYRHPGVVEVTKLLHSRIKPQIPGLDKFYKAAERGEWKQACKDLRAYFAAAQPAGAPNPKYDTKVADEYAAGHLNFAGIPRESVVPIDWAYQYNTDWYEHKNFLNRGSMLSAPINAYYNTGDKKWAVAFKKTFYDWIEANPKPPITSVADFATWRTLDSAARLGHIQSMFPVVTAAKGVDDELWANVLFSIWEHCDFLSGDNVSGGNWLAINSSNVMAVAIKFPEFADQKVWFDFGKSSFERNVVDDILPDGKEVEDAPGYIAFAFKGMLGTLKALDEAGVQVNPETRERLNKVQNFLGSITQPNGDTPGIGDWGSGGAYSLPASWPFFKREDIRYIVTQGKEGVMPAWTSINFPDGGWSVMRSAWDTKPFEDAKHLVFKTSRGGHGHDDVLMVSNYAYGRPLLMDPGIRSYERRDIDLYTHTNYHNTICVDGKTMGHTAGKTEAWQSNDRYDFVVGSHQNYKGLTVRRTVIFVKPEYWIVHDEVTGEGSHTYDQNWHFAEDAGITQDSMTKAVRTNYATGGNLLMVPAAPETFKSEQTSFFIPKERMAGEQREVESKGWRYSQTGPAPVSFDVVLYPYSGPNAPKVSVKRLQALRSGPSALEIQIDGKTQIVTFSQTEVRISNK